MFFTDHKQTTLRIAQAQTRVIMSPKTLNAIVHKTTPKGDVLELARAAGVMAAKKTSDLIPYCHPLPLDGVEVNFKFLDDGIQIQSVVKAVWKTGVEMEALTAVSIAALTIYDMCKPIDKNMVIQDTKLTHKKGGKSDYEEKFLKSLKAAIIVTSDGTYKGTREDKSGKIIQERLKQLGIQEIAYTILPDERGEIQNKILNYCKEGCHLVITTGGTGLGPRDVTVEATKAIIEREVPGISEAMRNHGQQRTPYAMLSRGLVGLRDKTLIINLPGSSKGVDESMDAIFPAVFHAYKMMGGSGH